MCTKYKPGTTDYILIPGIGGSNVTRSDVSGGNPHVYEAEEHRGRHAMMATCLLSGTRVFPSIGMQRASSMARSQAIYLRPALTMHKNDPSQPLSPRALHHVHGSAHYRWPNAHSISCASHRNNAEITPLPQLPDGDPESRRNCGRAVRVLSCETFASTLPVPTCGIPESPP